MHFECAFEDYFRYPRDVFGIQSVAPLSHNFLIYDLFVLQAEENSQENPLMARFAKITHQHIMQSTEKIISQLCGSPIFCQVCGFFDHLEFLETFSLKSQDSDNSLGMVMDPIKSGLTADSQSIRFQCYLGSWQAYLYTPWARFAHYRLDAMTAKPRKPLVLGLM